MVEEDRTKQEGTAEPNEAENAQADAEDIAEEVKEPSEEAEAPEEPEGSDEETAGDEESSSDDGEEAEEAANEEETDGDTKKEGRGLFKKKKDKRDEQIADLDDKLKRQMAEFDNFRRRSEKEKSQMFDMGAKSLLEKILPVVDNFERGLAAVPEEQKEDAFVSGMDMIYKQLMTELENAGVKPIECVGREFDPEYHNAVSQVESDEYESGYVAQELQKGYMYKNSVVRHSMVAVVP